MTHKKKIIKTLAALDQHQLINHADLPALQSVVENFSVSITEDMLNLIDHSDPHDAIRKQFIPDIKESAITALEKKDPIGDTIYKKVNGIIHRYPDRCLFTPVHVCPVYCRFCFRKEKVGHANETLTPTDITNAFDYIRNHTEIWEVIMTGGDPLILKPAVLREYIQQLNSIDHVDVIRIHTRVPVVDPDRINDELIAALKCKKAVYVLLHANHPKEFTPNAERACALLIDHGIPMLSQTVLLKGINDHIDTLSQLMRSFIKNRIKPYYLHHADLTRGTQHFRTSILEGQALMKQLRGRFSGLCQPTYVLDIPDGFGKVPIGPNYVANMDADHYEIEDYLGRLHQYWCD